MRHILWFKCGGQYKKKKSKSQSSVLHQPCNTEAATGLEAILLGLQVFPRAPKKVGVASVESMEPHWRLEDIMGSSLMGRLAFLWNVFSLWGADSYEWQVTCPRLRLETSPKVCGGGALSTVRRTPVPSSARGELAPENRRPVCPLVLYPAVLRPQLPGLAGPGSRGF